MANKKIQEKKTKTLKITESVFKSLNLYKVNGNFKTFSDAIKEAIEGGKS